MCIVDFEMLEILNELLFNGHRPVLLDEPDVYSQNTSISIY